MTGRSFGNRSRIFDFKVPEGINRLKLQVTRGRNPTSSFSTGAGEEQLTEAGGPSLAA